MPIRPGMGSRHGTLLVDGLFRATWRIMLKRDTAILDVEPFARLPERDAILEEGERLLAFAAASAARYDIRIAAT